MLVYALVLLALLLLSAFFSSAETAFLSMQRIQLEHRVRAGVPGAAAIVRLLDRPHRLLSAVRLGRQLTNAGVAVTGAVIALALLPRGWGALGATVVVTMLLVLFGEVVPKAIALGHSFAIGRLWAIPMAVWTRITWPVTFALDGLTRLLLRVFGNPEAISPVTLDVAELRTAIRLGVESGAIEVNASNRLIGAITLQQRQVQEIMTPRTEMVLAGVGEPLRDVAARLAQYGFQRMPVYEGSPDEIVGYVHVGDVNVSHLGGIEQRSVRDIMRPAVFESEHSPIARVLAVMQERASYLVLLVDEFGTTSGLVTLEDIMEEVVGTLRSESMEGGAEAVSGKRAARDGRRLEVEGSRLLVDLSLELDVDVTQVDANTVAGLVLYYTRRFPEPGESVDHKGCRFTVLEADERRVRRVAVERLGHDGMRADTR
ncbi:MAG: DUF21 domain-containing protein [Dehalococcoidia bacterium]|nr:DUF21 domain-containing protein [Dehalococcoidia bacterium]